MLRMIIDKNIKLREGKSLNGQALEQIKALNRIDLAFSCITIGGGIISKKMVEKIMGGSFIDEATLEEHQLIDNLSYTYDEMEKLLEMDNDLNEKILIRLFNTLKPGQEFSYRRGNPVLLEYGFNPVYSKDIENEMDKIFRWLYSSDVSPEVSNNPLLRAALLFNRIIQVYPFEEDSEIFAGLLMYYYLMQIGFPPFVLRFSYREYIEAVTEYIKRNSIDKFYNCLERSLYNKLDVMLQIKSFEE